MAEPGDEIREAPPSIFEDGATATDPAGKFVGTGALGRMFDDPDLTGFQKPKAAQRALEFPAAPDDEVREAPRSMFDDEATASDPARKFVSNSAFGRMFDDPDLTGFQKPKAAQRALELPAARPARIMDRKRSPTSVWVESALGGSDIWEAVRRYGTTGNEHFVVMASEVDEKLRRLQALALFESQAWAFCKSAVRVEACEDGWFVVEFQRIQGDSIAFNDVFLLACRALRDAGFTVCNSDKQQKEEQGVPESVPDLQGR